MSTTTATVSSPRDLSSPPPSQEFPAISPTLRHRWKNGKPAGSYGCVREVYHPLSPLAEPSAILYYESEGDDEDSSQSSRPMLPPDLTDASPIPRRNLSVGTLDARSGNTSNQASDHKSPNFASLSRKRTQQADVSDLFGLPTNAVHILTDEETKAKRSRNELLSGRNLSYGTSPNNTESDYNAETPKTPARSTDETKGPQTPKGKGSVREEGSASERKLQESPQFIPPSETVRGSSQQKTPNQHTYRKLPTTSPRTFPLPESPIGSEQGSAHSSRSGSVESSPVHTANNKERLESRNRAAAHAEALANRLEILHIKAQEYSESITRQPVDKKLARELDALFSKENRFDPREAALLEEQFQEKIRVVYNKRLAEEEEQAEIARQEQERLRVAEAARKAAEELKQRQEEERRRKQEEELERQRQEALAAQAAREAQQKREAEAKRQAEEKARQEEAARQKAESDRQAAAKAQQDAAAAQASRASQASQTSQASQAAAQAPTQPAGPQVYGRPSVEVEKANVQRVINNLKELKTLSSDYLKDTGLKQIRRDMVPKFGQLTGERQQTVQVRESIKNMLNQVMTISGPSTPVSKYTFLPPETDVSLPAGFVWIVNELAKMAVKQVLQECTAKPDAADSIGVVIAAIFADSKYSAGGKSLIDIFVARFLKWNPILLGEDGPDSSDADRTRLRWKRENDGKTEREDTYATRIQALTAGFVAIAGRDFGKSTMINPYPPFHLWHSLTTILNKPTDKLTNTHYFAVNTILQAGGKKLCGIYGRQAKKVIMVAVGPWAERGVQTKCLGAQAVVATGLVMQKSDWWEAIR
ncbi:GLE1-like protein-domain-containing protein [Pyronema omphalodes]|nr:GLE1-like protein-domain-containing protein [Pyronema omphalodes]